MEDSLTEIENTDPNKGYLDERFEIKMSTTINELSTDHATAYEVIDASGQETQDTVYALIFSSSFPTRLETIQSLQKIKHPNLQNLISFGKILLGASQTEKFAVILQKPIGIKLSDYMQTHNGFEEIILANVVLKQLFSAIYILNDYNIVHGSINPNKVYFNSDTSKIMLGECISDICGNSQLPSCDAIDQLLCNTECKGDLDLKIDYYAVGVMILYLLSGTLPFIGLSRKLITQIRLGNGSYESSIIFIRLSTAFSLSRHMDSLVRGLMTDNRRVRWKEEEVEKWFNKEEIAPPLPSRNAGTPFLFNDVDYYNTKSLAHALFQNWTVARKEINITDVSRWLSLSVKNADDAQNVLNLNANNSAMLLSDEKLNRLITTLDPDGPIRYQSFSGHISGIGFAIANSYLNNDTKTLDQLETLFNSSILDYWIMHQHENSDFRIKSLRWRPQRVRKYIANKNIGFGIERILYELNPGMPCQSPLLENSYVISVEELLESLDKFSGDQAQTNPVDLHIGAFLASKLGLADDIKIKSLQNFPHVAKNPDILMINLLSLAQSVKNVVPVKNLTVWLRGRLNNYVESLNSRIIKKDIKNKLDDVADSGNVSAIFKIISNPNYARKDLYGFQEARSYYKMLSSHIQSLQKQSNIQLLAYQLGLRISVSISYLVCTFTFVYIILQAAS